MDKDEDVAMKDAPSPPEDEGHAAAGAEPPERSIFAIPGAWPESEDDEPKPATFPAVRQRVGRGGRIWLETKKRRPRGELARGVVSDDDSDDDYEPDYFPVPERITFEYRAALNNRATVRPEGVNSEQRQRQWGPEQAAAAATAGAASHAHPQAPQPVAVGGPG